MNVIELENVSKIFYKTAGIGEILTRFKIREEIPVLNNIDFSVQAGEFIVLKGENGAGKSTLLQLILGLSKPTAGSVKLMELLPQCPSAKNSVGVVLQETQVPPQIKVRELIELWRSYYPSSLTGEEILNKVNLTYKAEAWLTDLSGGQKQRLYFALALTGNPNLLILDEPTRNLDNEGYQEFWQQIKLCRQQKTTILMVTNNKSDWEELNQLATKTIILYKLDKVSSESQLVQGELFESNTNSESENLDKNNITQLLSSSSLEIFKKQFWFEGLQLLRTPTFLGSLIVFILFVPLLQFIDIKGENAISAIVNICGIFLLTIVIDRLGTRVAVERSEKWFKLLRVTPLPPIIHIAAKIATLLVTGIFILLSIFILGIWQLKIQADLSFWIALFSSLIIGIVPFAFMGLALGYWVEPKSAGSLLSLSLIIIPILSGALPVLVGFSILPDLIVLSPFYHYRELVLWAGRQQNYDHRTLIHLLWLFWAYGVFGFMAIWSYQREEAIK